MDTEYHLVLFRLASSRIEIHHEYFMYDMVSVVSSIGGGIGIFLGYSFFGILSSAINKLFQNNWNKALNFLFYSFKWNSCKFLIFLNNWLYIYILLSMCIKAVSIWFFLKNRLGWDVCCTFFFIFRHVKLRVCHQERWLPLGVLPFWPILNNQLLQATGLGHFHIPVEVF